MQYIFSMGDIGAAIRARRRELGYTQTELADRVGVGVTFLSQVENGKETAEAGKILHVLQMLGMNVYLEKRR